MKETDVAGIAPGAIDAMRARERSRYEAQHPRSRALAAQAAEHWFQGVPMHWMLDWDTPFPLFVKEAQGATLTDADGNSYADFCLGTPAPCSATRPSRLPRCCSARACGG